MKEKPMDLKDSGGKVYGRVSREERGKEKRCDYMLIKKKSQERKKTKTKQNKATTISKQPQGTPDFCEQAEASLRKKYSSPGHTSEACPPGHTCEVSHCGHICEAHSPGHTCEANSLVTPLRPVVLLTPVRPITLVIPMRAFPWSHL